jgi:asparagine synthase (glutamine-hydrolysing)
MSGIFGILKLDDRPVASEALERLAGQMAYRGPDGTHIWQEGGVGFGHCMLHTTPESLHEALPWTEPESGLTITTDARLDNRAELAEQLGLQTGGLERLGDSQILLAAYRKWGVDCGEKLLGDFSLAIWDSRRQRLFAVRDPLGIKPFYYCRSPRAFSFCSEVMPLCKLQPHLPEVNEGMVGEYLTFQFSNREETLFKNVFRLPPGHYLIVEVGIVTLRRYWDLSFPRALYYKDQNQYAEHFLDLFRQSVACRMRSHRPVSAELSGGLDSSSIVSTACGLKQGSPSQEIKPFALIFPGLPCDEQLYIDSVAKRWAIPVNRVPAQHYQPPDWQKQVFRSFHYPDMPNLSMCDTLVEKVQATGSRVILSGIGGDEWFTGYGLNLFDLAAHRRFSELCREMRRLGGPGYKALLSQAARVLLWPAIPFFLKKRRCEKNIWQALPDWLPPSFVARTNLLDRITMADGRLHQTSLIDASYYRYICSDLEGFFLETLDRHRAFAGVENRYPFLDRRLVEFAAVLPEYQKSSCGQTKSIVRQGLTGLLPEEVRSRTDKSEFSYFFGQAFLLPAFEKRMNELTISANGWIDKEKILESYRRTQQFFRIDPTKPCNRIWPIWFVFATELWFTSLYR